MKQAHKRDVFFKILKNLFGDRTDDINESNYLEFYHFLFSEIESYYNSSKEESDTSDKTKMLKKSIGILGNYDLMIDADPIMVEYFHSQHIFLEFLNNFTNISRKKFYKELFSLREWYKDVKAKFFS
jgi:hypothetical protein